MINKRCQVVEKASYYEHGDEDVLLGDLSMRKDALQHWGHVRLILLSEIDHTLVIVSCQSK